MITSIVIATRTEVRNLYVFENSIDILIFNPKIMYIIAKKVYFQFAERSLFYAKIMQVSAKKVYFQFAERSLFYAKVVKS